MKEHRRPVECTFCGSSKSNSYERRDSFRVTRSHGKTLANGGFGYIVGSATTAIITGQPQLQLQQQYTPNAASGAADNTQPSGVVAKCAAVLERDTTSSSMDNVNANASGESWSRAQQKQEEDVGAAPAPSEAIHYLFIEEVLFLHERGLLHAFAEDDNNDEVVVTRHDSSSERRQPMELSELYALLPVCNVSMAAYLVYQHVRAQTYRVVRHTETRQKLLRDMQDRLGLIQQHTDTLQQPVDDCSSAKGNGDDDDSLSRDEQQPASDMELKGNDDVVAPERSTCSGTSDLLDDDERKQQEQQQSMSAKRVRSTTRTTKNERRRGLLWRSDATFNALRHSLRRDAAQAPPPSVHACLPMEDNRGAQHHKPRPLRIAFDCYNPDASFSSACPGLPDFLVAITYYNNYNCFSGNVDDGAPNGRKQNGLLFGDLCSYLQTASDAVITRTTFSSSAEPTHANASVPLKIATVSDSGTVVMFGVTDYGVPVLQSS
jgi:hypothetical protein